MGGAKYSYSRSGTAGSVVTNESGRFYVTFGENVASVNYQTFITGLWSANYLFNVIGKYIHGFDVEVRNPDGSLAQAVQLSFDWRVDLSK